MHIQWNLSIPDTLGTAYGVLIIRGVLISWVVLYTFLCSWDHRQCPDKGRRPHFRGVLIEGCHCICIYTELIKVSYHVRKSKRERRKSFKDAAQHYYSYYRHSGKVHV